MKCDGSFYLTGGCLKAVELVHDFFQMGLDSDVYAGEQTKESQTVMLHEKGGGLGHVAHPKVCQEFPDVESEGLWMKY